MWWIEVNAWLWIVNYPWTDSNIYWAEVIVLATEICLIAYVEMLDGLEYLPQDVNCWFLQVGYLAVLVPLCCKFLKDMNVKTQWTNILSLCKSKSESMLNWGESCNRIWIFSSSIAASWSLLSIAYTLSTGSSWVRDRGVGTYFLECGFGGVLPLKK